MSSTHGLQRRRHPELGADATLFLVDAAGRIIAMVYEVSRRRDEARREYERLAARDFALPRDHNWLAFLFSLADLCAAFEDTPRAPLLYDLLRPYATRVVTFGFASGCAGTAAILLARLAATMSRYREDYLHGKRSRARHPLGVASLRANRFGHRGSPRVFVQTTRLHPRQSRFAARGTEDAFTPSSRR